MFFDEHASCRFRGVAIKVGDSVTTGIAWKERRADYTDSGNGIISFLSASMYWYVLLLGHAREDSNPGSLDCESAILPQS